MTRIARTAALLMLPLLATSPLAAEDLYAFAKFETGKAHTMVTDFKNDRTRTFTCTMTSQRGSQCVTWTGGPMPVTLKNGATLTCTHAIHARKKRGSYLKCGIGETVLISDKSNIERRCEKFVEIDEGKLDNCH